MRVYLSSLIIIGGALSAIVSEGVHANEISTVKDRPAVSTSAQTLLAQAPTQVTEIELERLQDGIELIFTTADGTVLKAQNQRREGNAIVAEINSAVLTQPFQASNPIAGIATVTVRQINPTQLQVRVVGTDHPPELDIVSAQSGLTLSVIPATDEEEVVVTATRTAERPADVPRSTTVLNRAQLEQQTSINRDLQTILSKTIPGLGASTENTSNFGQSLRGRTPLVLVDGVPITSNVNTDSTGADLRRLDSSAIERVEVVRGPSAIYGDGASGGVINLITRRPEAGFKAETELSVNSDNLRSRSFSTFVRQAISGTQNGTDYLFSFSVDSLAKAFDAEGDLIPAAGSFVTDGRTLNALGKVGFQLSPEQRLQVSVNQFDDRYKQSDNYDPIVLDIPGIQKARALDQSINFVDTTDPVNLGTIANLDYTHNNVFNSKLQAQLYYRRTRTADVLFDARTFDPETPLGVARSVATAERIGGRVQFDTPLSKTLSLLWGVDASSDANRADYDVFDADEFDASGRVTARKTRSAIRFPKFTINNLGIFSQAQWQVSDRVNLSGGVRYERFGVSVLDQFVAGENNVTAFGGDKTVDDFVFNAGAVYKATKQISLFANFAQGFSLPTIGRALVRPPEGFDFTRDVILTAPQKVNNYEIGVRGNWRNVQASLAAFYSFSELGALTQLTETSVELLRAPQRNYGIELALDWQPLKTWQLGGSISWVEGELKNDGGSFVALSSFDVQPIKLTAYVENETLPGWRNRLQALYIGSRDRAFTASIDPVGIDSYFLVDLVSSIKLGSGTLNIGIQNLFNNQYINVKNQILGGFDETFNTASRGRTITVGYRFTW
ncbi:TonB-dependent receptor domain-containing protein [Phormidesmis sp. 146-33]